MLLALAEVVVEAEACCHRDQACQAWEVEEEYQEQQGNRAILEAAAAAAAVVVEHRSRQAWAAVEVCLRGIRVALEGAVVEEVEVEDLLWFSVLRSPLQTSQHLA